MSIQPLLPASGTDEHITEPFVLLKAVADPYRLRILAILAASESAVCVCDFTSVLPLNQPTVSHHLKILREANLVTCERRGTWGYYSLEPQANTRLQDALNSVFQQKVKA